MPLLGTGLFLADSLRNRSGVNAAPTIGAVTLNFDLILNAAPIGMDQMMVFEVPSSPRPSGQDHALVFDVIAG